MKDTSIETVCYLFLRLIPLAMMIVAGCGESPRGGNASDPLPNRISGLPPESAQVVPPRQLTGNRVAGVRFDPRTVTRGARVGAMSLDSITVRTAFDSTRVGSAAFSGAVEISGSKLPHFDADATALCFEADSASAARLPRWEGDERRAWFCFTNRDAALRGLGAPGDSARATIVIDRLVIHRGMSDEVNEARFVRAITR